MNERSKTEEPLIPVHAMPCLLRSQPQLRLGPTAGGGRRRRRRTWGRTQDRVAACRPVGLRNLHRSSFLLSNLAIALHALFCTGAQPPHHSSLVIRGRGGAPRACPAPCRPPPAAGRLRGCAPAAAACPPLAPPPPPSLQGRGQPGDTSSEEQRPPLPCSQHSNTKRMHASNKQQSAAACRSPAATSSSTRLLATLLSAMSALALGAPPSFLVIRSCRGGGGAGAGAEGRV